MLYKSKTCREKGTMEFQKDKFMEKLSMACNYDEGKEPGALKDDDPKAAVGGEMTVDSYSQFASFSFVRNLRVNNPTM